MITSWYLTANRSEYITSRYDEISQQEGIRQLAYVDTKGIPSIGIGFNLRTDEVRDAVFEAMQINAEDPQLSSVQQAAEQGYMELLKAAIALPYAPGQNDILRPNLDAVMFNRAHDPLLQSFTHITSRTAFEMQSPEIQTVFDDIIDRIYEPSVDAWLPNIPDSDERVALVSLAYNGVVGFKADGSFKSPLLRQAIIDDQRAEAWYEIRYQSDADGQHTGRRIDESNLFGLYDHPELGVQEAEAKEVLQMYTAHREQIRTYESQHAQDYPTGGTTSIDFQLIGAKTPLIQAYAQFAGAPSIDGEVLVGSDLQRDTFDLQPVSIPGVPAHIFDLSKSDLLLGEGGDDFLRGRGGDDVLYGGAGDDRLVGDAGNDYLFGGAGFDTYVYATGDGHDRIEDSDANGVIFVNGQMLVGGVKKDGHTDWVSPDGHIQYVMQGTDLVVKLNGTQILTVNENFQSGQFGIRLVERAEERMTA